MQTESDSGKPFYVSRRLSVQNLERRVARGEKLTVFICVYGNYHSFLTDEASEVLLHKDLKSVWL